MLEERDSESGVKACGNKWESAIKKTKKTYCIGISELETPRRVAEMDSYYQVNDKRTVLLSAIKGTAEIWYGMGWVPEDFPLVIVLLACFALSFPITSHHKTVKQVLESREEPIISVFLGN